MRKLVSGIGTAALVLMGTAGFASAQDSPGYECDNSFGDCGTPEQSGGGGGCGCGGGSILVNNTDLGDTYQFADDYDDDGIEDVTDNCIRMANIDQADSDGDGFGDSCDNCLNTTNIAQLDIDGDSIGNACDNDIDGDSIDNAQDNCAQLPNPLVNGVQVDFDHDGQGDACDADIDGDGIDNLSDPCPTNADVLEPVGDQIATCFPDDDGDRHNNTIDLCPLVYDPDQSDLDQDGRGDACDDDKDGDGVPNFRDNCSVSDNVAQLDSDRDGLGDACDDHFCFWVLGDKENCLDPEAVLSVYSPPSLVTTGESIRLRLFANRQNQAMRYTWTVTSSPDGSTSTVANAKGTVVQSTPFEYHYVADETPRFSPDMPGEYTVQVTVETIWEDRYSKQIGEVATYEMNINVEGEPVSSSDGEGCSVNLGTTGGTTGALLFAGAFCLLALRRRRNG